MITKKKLINLIVVSCLSLGLIFTSHSCANNQQQLLVKNPVRIGISSENLILENEIANLTRKATRKPATIITKGSVSLTKLACAGELDAIAIADEMWGNIICPNAGWVDTADSLYQTRIQFALPQKTAQRLGWEQRVVPRQEILAALKSGKLQLATTIPTHSNSGYNTLLWLTRAEINSNLTPEQITPQTLKPLQPIYQNLAQSSESTSYLAEKLASSWQPNTLAALYRFLYASDGTALLIKGARIPLAESVSLIEVTPAITVTPTWFVTTENEKLKQQLIEQVFSQLETENPQIFQQLQASNPPLPPTVTRETTPVTTVHQSLLNSFHPSIRQKRWIVGIIDASGSMKGEGFKQLLAAFSQLLEPKKAQANFLYSPEDRFNLIVYQGNSAYSIPRNPKSGLAVPREALWQTLSQQVKVGGGTPVDRGLITGFKTALDIPADYQVEIFLFTDGRFSNPVTPQLLQLSQTLQNRGAEFTIVGAGDIDKGQLQQLADKLAARPIISQDASQTLEELLKAFREAQI